MGVASRLQPWVPLLESWSEQMELCLRQLPAGG